MVNLIYIFGVVVLDGVIVVWVWDGICIECS